ncbi:hypothetical protein V6O07_16085, partial [Arthrospira platensis SPKY2]
SNTELLSVEIHDMVYESTDVTHFIRFEDQELIASELIISSQTVMARKNAGVHISFIPLLKDEKAHRIIRLKSFTIKITYKQKDEQRTLKSRNYATQSVLASGNWYKFAVSANGVY